MIIMTTEKVSIRRIDPVRLAEAEELMTIDPEAVAFEAESGNPESQLHLGLCHLAGHRVEQSDAEGARWISRCASKGYAEAQYAMSRLFLDGRGVTESVPKAMDMMIRSAEQGCHHALYTIGVMKAYGIATERDPECAAMCLSAAAEQGHPESMLKLGLMRCEGYGTPRDEAAGAELVKKAASAGDPDAAFLMRNGALDWDSLDWFVDLGSPCIGPTYVDSRLFAEYDGAFLESVSASAEGGSMQARAYLGELMLEGTIAEGSEDAAARLLEAAFADGDPYSGYLLGVLMMDSDVQEAYAMIAQAAERGIPAAEGYLGDHVKGESFTEYLRRAASGYMARSRDGDAEAMYRLGIMYMNGWGVPCSEQKALDWLEKAVSAGHPDANDAISDLL